MFSPAFAGCFKLQGCTFFLSLAAFIAVILDNAMMSDSFEFDAVLAIGILLFVGLYVAYYFLVRLVSRKVFMAIKNQLTS